MGAVTAAYRYYKGSFIDIPLVIPCAAASLAGSAVGSTLSLVTSEEFLRIVLLVVLPVTAFYVYKRKNFDNAEDKTLSRKKTFVIATLILLVVGTYDGFFGPGTGTFLILLYTGLAKIKLLTASGNAKAVNLASNAAALAVFLANRQTNIPLGLCAGIFSIIGSYLGSSFAIKKGATVIRAVILFVLALLFARLVWEYAFK
jgi:uncharacterized membrane protein YfcA